MKMREWLWASGFLVLVIFLIWLGNKLEAKRMEQERQERR